jgi:hypothetical protein
MIIISEKAKHHLRLHFGDSNAAGSVFFKQVFQSPEELLLYINSCEPSEIFYQGSNRKALVFHMAEAVGTSGLIRRNEVTAENVILESRNGFEVEVALLKELSQTYEFCAIVEIINDMEYLITAFPGGYSLSFPYEGQESEEYEKSKLFWQEYILCRKA